MILVMNEKEQIEQALAQTSYDAQAVIMVTLKIEQEYLHQRSPKNLGEEIAEEVRKTIK